MEVHANSFIQIDLVVCSTRVDVHYPTIRPSLVAGKDAFVEWPLASNAKDAEELTRLAKEKNVKTIVGLQGRVSPIYLKIKQVLESGKIGKVVSSSIALTGGINSRDSVPEGLAYFFNSKIGGNMFTIYGGHRKSFTSPANAHEEEFLKRTSLSIRLPELRPRAHKAHRIPPQRHPP